MKTKNTVRKLGLLEHKASHRMEADFSMTDDELSLSKNKAIKSYRNKGLWLLDT
ncbi:MAG: hypothetical protein ACD_41C00127G0003 [uncultured bacterium]|nr:MAG: hypothetical protein ACD_41C00127G0003 [uncultured bacterium]